MPARPLIENPKDIRLNEQDEVQSLLGQAPGWMLRWGIPFVGIGALVLLLLSAWVQYPDLVIGRASILAGNNPPVRVMAPRDGRIREVMVNPGDTVRQSQVLGVIENAASTAEVFALEEALAGMSGPSGSSESPFSGKYRQLGDIQSPYAEWQRRLSEFQDARNEDHTQKAIRVLKDQTNTLEATGASLERQMNTLKREVELAEKHANVVQGLFQSGANSEEDKEKAESAYLRYVRELEVKKSEILGNRLAIERIRAQQLELERLAEERLRSEILLLRESANRLSSAIQSWRQHYCLVAPASGVVFPEGAWAAQQYLRSGEAAFTIIPATGNIAVARAWIGADGLGKVKPGADVQLRLDAFPYKEYGILEGRVKSIAPVPSGSPNEGVRYLAEIDLTGNMITTYGITLPSQQEMPATARIITEKRSLLQRIFDQFLDAYYSRG